MEKDKPRRRRRSSARPPRRLQNKEFYWRQPRTRSNSAPPHPRPKKIEWTPAEREVIQAFYAEAIDEMAKCVSMTEEEQQEEYRRAGKLHKFDPFTEMEKRYA
ncbi:hypothetical protein BDA96_03G067500 [Sorghum bicolor]|uniref:Uncharacterized protein n=2 Tax=Sorghum bicolor TaxID=4558 RepID=A0A1B6Q1M6_SORBI|nr:hypothetical protein BDA96_03G067500 [Sorghum bicolor]KXG31827.1 hypothetical protein SORBI_3003G064000 [Sorghum bicolor]